ncbi:MAG: autotransporter domain-containing protein, partial [Elusimicrobiota bacterium]|nr:autotransporter domain-containing protein [Elusimicrobiota bacterium]
ANIDKVDISSGGHLNIQSDYITIGSLYIDKNSSLDFGLNEYNIHDLKLTQSSQILGRVIVNLNPPHDQSSTITLEADDAVLNIEGAILDLSALTRAHASGFITQSDMTLLQIKSTNDSSHIEGEFVNEWGQIYNVGRVWTWYVLNDYDQVIDTSGGSGSGFSAGGARLTSNGVVKVELILESKALPMENVVDLNYNQDQARGAVYYSIMGDNKSMVEMWDAAEWIANNELYDFALYFEQLSGSFIATLLTLPAIDINPNGFYQYFENDPNRIWVQASAGGYQIDKDNIIGTFKSLGTEGSVGMDIYYSSPTKVGVYAFGSERDVEQGHANVANITSFGGGVYVGFFDLLWKTVDIKANVGASLDNIYEKRGINIDFKETVEANFNSKTLKAKMEMDFMPGIVVGGVNIGLFGRLNFGWVENDAFEERYSKGKHAALGVDKQDYRRLQTDGGLMLTRNFGKGLDLTVRAYGISLTAGDRELYRMYFLVSPTSIMEIENAKQADTGVGGDILLSYKLSNRFDFKANASLQTALDSDDMLYGGGVGIRWWFNMNSYYAKQKAKRRAAAFKIVAQKYFLSRLDEIQDLKGDVPIDLTNLITLADFIKFYLDHPDYFEQQRKYQEYLRRYFVSLLDQYLEENTEKPTKGMVLPPPSRVWGLQETIFVGDMYMITPVIILEPKKFEYFLEDYLRNPQKFRHRPILRVVSEQDRESTEEFLKTAYEATVAHFAFNVWTLPESALRGLDVEAKKIIDQGYSRVVIVGYADSIGSDEINNQISYRRAETVYYELVKSGIDPNKIVFLGRGKRDPVAPNTTEANRAQNRRVEVFAK